MSLLLTLGGCALDESAGGGASSPPTADTGTATATEDGFERVIISEVHYPEDGRELLSSDFSPDLGGNPGADPCFCTTDSCLEDWADTALGCDVCVSLYCDGSPGPHVCHACVR